MTFQVLDSETRSTIKVVSYCKSLIWTERFQDVGDFELVVDLTKDNVETYTEDRYLLLSESQTLMIIEKIQIDIENGELTISGHSFENVLYRRIWHDWNNEKDKLPNHTLEDCFKTSITKTFHNFSSNPNGVVQYIDDNHWGDFPVTDLISEARWYYPQRGDNIGTYLYTLAEAYRFGIKAVFNQSTKNITFVPYIGANRKYITFGKGSYNLKDSKYVKDNTNFLTTALVAGQGEGASRQVITVSKSLTIQNESSYEEIVEYTGIKQRETFVDARDIQKATGETNTAYKERLKQRGAETLLTAGIEENVDGTVTNAGPYLLNKNYFLGDIVTVREGYYTAEARIDEIIRYWDNNNQYEIYPTLKVLSISTLTKIVSTNIN